MTVCLTCGSAGGYILQGGEEHATAEGALCWPGSPFSRHVEDGVGLEERGDQQLHQAAHLGLDPCAWGIKTRHELVHCQNDDRKPAIYLNVRPQAASGCGQSVSALRSGCLVNMTLDLHLSEQRTSSIHLQKYLRVRG